jgi:hypothetical protein
MSFTESGMQQMRDEAWRREKLVEQHIAAKMIGIDVRTLRRWHRRGIGPERQVRVRKKPIFYSRVEVEQFAATYNSALGVQSPANGHLEIDHEQTAANGHSEVS